MIHHAPPPVADTMREYYMTVRQCLLLELDVIEKMIDITPRTSEIRKAAKGERAYNEVERKLEG